MTGEITEETLIGGEMYRGRDAHDIYAGIEHRRLRLERLAAEMALREINERPYMPCFESYRRDGPGFAG